MAYKQPSSGPFKMMGSSPAKTELLKKPVGPRATKKKIKENNSVPLLPGFEDPVKIQKVQREGLTPNSQKFSKIAKKNANQKGQDNPKYRGNYDEVD